MTDVQTGTKKETPLAIIVADLNRHEQQIVSALPRHIPADKFKRTLIGVLSVNPDMVRAAASHPDARMSLIRECQKAATDGLILDGREAALVKFKRKVKDEDGNDEYVDDLKYMPMVQGVLKRMRNSGELASIECEVVYENDHFRHVKGDNASIEHVPYYSRDDGNFEEPGELKFAYVTALTKDGLRVREVMTKFDIARVKARSKSQDKKGVHYGPWKDDEPEMWRKSVLHRAAKYLPKSSDKETGENVTQLIERDNELYEDTINPDTGEITETPVRRTRTPRQPTTIEGESKPAAETKPAAAPKPAETKKPETKPAEQKPAGGARALLDGDSNPDDDI